MTKNSNDPRASEANPDEKVAAALEAAADAISDAARSDATAAANVAAAKLRSGVSAGAYYSAYGVSYGVVFSGVFLKELLPLDSSIRRGFEQGVQDGSKAAIDTVARIHVVAELADEPPNEAPAAVAATN